MNRKKADLANLPAEKKWLSAIIGFDRVDQYNNMIEIYYTGTGTTAFEQMSDEKVLADVLWLIGKFLSKTIPQPTRMWRTRWESARNFLGSYSFASMSAYQNGATISALYERLYDASGKPRILFAGEATHISQSSFAHGALLSGYREADFLQPRMLL